MIKTGEPEERTAAVSGKSRDEASSRYISTKALEIVSQGARINPDGENTVAVTESGGETTVYRVFRQRHMDGKSPLAEADQWIRDVKELCRGASGELKASALWTDVDEGSVLVCVTGRRIVAKGETGQFIS